LSYTADVQRALHEVERERLVLSGHRQCGGLLKVPGQFLEVRPGEETEVRLHRTGQPDDPGANAVAAGGRDVADQAAVRERGQDPRDRAHVDPGPAGDLV